MCQIYTLKLMRLILNDGWRPATFLKMNSYTGIFEGF